MSDDNPTDEDDSLPEADSEMMRGVSLSVDATLELLAHRDRRHALRFLNGRDECVVSIDELVEFLVETKAKRDGKLPSRDHTLAELVHIHLPKLAEGDVIAYDERSQQLRYWGDDRLEQWLARIDESEEMPRED